MKLLPILAVASLCLLPSCEKANHAPSPASGGSGAGEAADASGAKPYPLTTCIVQDEPLGSMGKPVSVVHEGQEYKFCCRSCIPEFEEEPAKYAEKLAAKVAEGEKPAETP